MILRHRCFRQLHVPAVLAFCFSLACVGGCSKNDTITLPVQDQVKTDSPPPNAPKATGKSGAPDDMGVKFRGKNKKGGM